MSGPGVPDLLDRMAGGQLEPRRAVLTDIVDPRDGTVIDRGLVLFFPGPASFTGEDVAEFHLHGGRAVIATMVDALGALPGYRAAEAGEFTRRAFDNGRMDLTEAEGLADLVAADTEMQRRQALRQAGGALARRYESWRERLLRARAMIEAELDFADEDDVPADISARALPEIASVAAEIRAELARPATERLRDGTDIVLLGAPNAGKSTLLNTLAGREAAIVTEEPGTTRDLIEIRLDLSGYPATLVDTAGLRETEGRVEKEGVRRALARAEAADLILVLADAAAETEPPAVGAGAERILVGTKADLIDSPTERESIRSRYDHLISAQTGQGLDALLADLAARVAARFEQAESSVITRARHRQALTECAAALAEAETKAAREGPELVAEYLRRATDALGRVTGRIGVEDVLGAIFGEFCIGK